MTRTQPYFIGRLTSIDFTRGIVIVIMALDHIRDLLHTGGVTGDPLDLNTTTPGLFMTRFITHFCAPVFVFLAGTSAYLMTRQQNNLLKTQNFLFSRGIWLIFLEIVVVGFGIWWDLKFRTILFQVIFAIGMGFVILSGLIRIQSTVLGVIGLFIVFFHNALPNLEFPNNAFADFVWKLLFHRGFFKLGSEHALIVGYAVVPWLGIMLFGFGFGKVFELEVTKRKQVLLFSGFFALLVFVVLRYFNLYGDPSPWSPKSTFVFSTLSFINVSKYPPSLLYAALTLGIMFFILFLVEGKNNRMTRFFVIYGRVPMFFYLLHWYIVHISMFVMILLQGVTFEQMPFGLMNFGRPAEGVGLDLPYVYLYWASLILFMYPLCKWYGNYKAGNKQKKWLAYF